MDAIDRLFRDYFIHQSMQNLKEVVRRYEAGELPLIPVKTRIQISNVVEELLHHARVG